MRTPLVLAAALLAACASDAASLQRVGFEVASPYATRDEIAARMLHGVPTFMRRNCRRCRISTVKYIRAQINCFVCRIVMICQLTIYRNDTYIRDAMVGQHPIRNFLT